MILSVHQPQYLPWLGYFHKIFSSDHFVYLDCVQYKEREFQNRNRIGTSDGWIWLTVPVISSSCGRQVMREVRIDNSFPWRRKHRESIRNCYAGCPYFERYFSFFESVYSSGWNLLIDLNVHIIAFLAREFGIRTPVSYESLVGTSSLKSERIVELCVKLGAQTYLSGQGGKAYLEESRFKQEHILVEYQQFTHPIYKQHTRTIGDFLPYLSAIDLLFNEGPASRDILFSCARPAVPSIKENL
jgi:hypothetical protein